MWMLSCMKSALCALCGFIDALFALSRVPDTEKLRSASAELIGMAKIILDKLKRIGSLAPLRFQNSNTSSKLALKLEQSCR